LALDENAPEITSEHLLGAVRKIDTDGPPAPPVGPYVPVPFHELPCAQDVVAIIMNIGGLEHMTEESRRAALEQSR